MKTKSREMNFLYIPGAIFFVLSLTIFCAASAYDWDIQVFLAQAIQYKAAKAWVLFMDMWGVFQFLPVLILFLGVIWETSFVYFQKYWKKDFFRNNEWVVNLYYLAAFTLYVATTFIWLDDAINSDQGFGVGNDALIVDSNEYKIYAIILVKIFELIALIAITYYLRFKFSKREDIFVQEYWVDSLKGIFYISASYIIVILMKNSFGRPYYYSTIFNEILNTEVAAKGWTYNPDVLTWGGGQFGVDNVEYKNWWEPNDFLNNLENWFKGDVEKTQTNAWWNVDFPSGHTTSTFCVLTVMYLFINPNKERKLNKRKIAFIYIWIFVVLTSMKFALVVYRSHWWTDVEFSTFFGIFMFPFSSMVMNRMLRYFINHFKTKNKFEKVMGWAHISKRSFTIYTYNGLYHLKVGKYLYTKDPTEQINKVMKFYKINVMLKKDTLEQALGDHTN
ncbi:hypothetical protein SHELI_v1c10610 [Spiroplasma helicoides]|uniref:Phosphatidic acid phosphatase type 2/haloperoxidase domain-containing protein n=1 Tax=Spiroplasma helicoides TaxID=216938 RepID=A0A1B3SM51_9MOLU|nr:phosphatase PAP2 family protein [Spiroplasma helicoides]AOG61008.1 hypothetical protein SHELI_v1c10610 [Spiroplasma helicoides]